MTALIYNPSHSNKEMLLDNIYFYKKWETKFNIINNNDCNKKPTKYKQMINQ